MKHFLLAALLLSFAVLFAAAQEVDPQNQEAASPPVENDDTVYVIRHMDFDIIGRTKPYAIVLNGEFKEGERIKGKKNLDDYLALKTQLLLNVRVLEEVSIEYSLGPGEEDGALPVKLLIHTKDTFNFVMLPYPKYDSNTGLTISLKTRDYNFLGTMTPLAVDTGYQHDQHGYDKFFFMVGASIPFQYAGLDWNFTFDNAFQYTIGQPLYYQNITGLSVALPWQTTTFTVGFNQYATFNEENTDDAIARYGLPQWNYGGYATTELFASWKIPSGIKIGNFGELTYTPSISGKVNYPYAQMDESRKPVTTFSQSLWFGRIDWIGNYQKGLMASLTNAYDYYIGVADGPLCTSLDAEIVYHHPFSKYFGFSGRISMRGWWQHSDKTGDWIPYYTAGDTIRGVIDDYIRADYIVSMNLDFPIRILRFWPSEWFNNPKLHFFDFEMQFSPFTDMALMKGPYSKIKNYDNPSAGAVSFSLADMINTAGFEIIVYPAFFHSFYIRGSVGYNIRKIMNEGLTLLGGFLPYWDEIYVGVDHYY